ncbi:MAG: hypothetical protein E7224_00570 [Clostridiales bacterium]|nr:hypothetical protein [Clostridiales bacterium]
MDGIFHTEAMGCPKVGVKLSSGQLLYYERAVLCGHICPGIPPARLIEGAGEAVLYYDCRDLLSLKACLTKKELLCVDLLRILSGIVTVLMEARDHLLVPELFLLDTDHVFLHPKEGSPRILYVPLGSRETSFRRNLCSFLQEIDCIFPDPQWQAYSPGIREAVLDQNMGLESILRLLQEKEQHMFQSHRSSPAEGSVSTEGEIPFEPSVGGSRKTQGALRSLFLRGI